jgi:GTP pyrophosphokinase
MEIDLEQERKEILAQFKSLLRSVRNLTPDKTKRIRKAFDVALEAHKDMRRKSGEAYIFHPISVAKICAKEIGLGTTSVICALLHDTVEDTHITLDDIEELFGLEVRKIIDGLTKIPEVFDENASIQAENFRKMILTISDDIRVVLIKLADRLHNMRTLDGMRADKRLKIASETKFLYAPLAHRLGLYAIKSELDDLIFKNTDPDTYEMLVKKLKSSEDVRTRFIRRFINPIKSALENEGYKFDIKARTKSIASIWKKMQSKGVPFEEVYDLFAVRIIVDSSPENEKSDCWGVYSVVTDFYQPSPERLRDWISTPRANGYESLHTTVMSPQGKWVEVQIRTKRMDEVAEKGLAAHYKYKESDNDNSVSKLDRWIAEVRDLIENQDLSAMEFVNEFKMNLFSDEIYVFTPKGDLRVLPVGATILDFAYDIHTHIGNTCIGAKVNMKLVPLSYELHNGDQVEIITSAKQKPTEDWLKMVASARSKNKIRETLNDERKIIALDGKEILERKLKQLNLRNIQENITLIREFFELSSDIDLFIRIAKSKIDLNKIREIEEKGGVLQYGLKSVRHKDTHELDVYPKIDKKQDVLIVGENFKDIQYKLAKCCRPIPGDEILGFITKSEGIKVHRSNCKVLTDLMSRYAYRCVKAKWKQQKLTSHNVKLKLVGIDDVGIVNRITEIISNQLNVDMQSIYFRAKDGLFEGEIEVLVYDREHLDALVNKFQLIEGVKRIERVEEDTREDVEEDRNEIRLD